MSIKNYLSIARPNHWFKNLFILPGTIIAVMFTHISMSQLTCQFILGVISVCLIASANYVLNEWVDARFDRFHPLKKNRPSVIGSVKASLVYIEYIVLIFCGLTLALLVSSHFLAVSIIFLITAILYNVRPFRTKDRVYLDVLSESINNPIRLMLGWYIVTNYPAPPSSLLLGYWMAGAFLMSMKRYSELRCLEDSTVAGLYRRSFRFYTEDKLLISSFFYGVCSAFFLGVFLIKYRIELLISLPFFAILFTWYLHLGMKPDSPVQNPECLYREKSFIIYVVFFVILLGILLYIDIPWLRWFLGNAFINAQ
jgi:4-hydroxybenzoate polyprenyltransferase